MSQHAVLKPSAMARAVQCPASVGLSAMYPQSETEDQQLGHAAHWVATQLIAQKAMPDTAPNGIIIDDEMLAGAKLYADHVHEVCAEQGEPYEMHTEEYVACESIHPLNGGTPDNWLFNRARAVLHVWDFKFGHRHVEVFQNWQMIDYSAGILEKLGIDGLADQYVTVRFHVVQPRCYHASGPIRTWTVTASDLRGFYNRLREVCAEALSPAPATNTGDNCRDCEARHACSAHLRSGYNAIEASGAALPMELSPAAVGVILQQVQTARSRLDALETGLSTQVLNMLRSGKVVPGYHLEQGTGRDRWTKAHAEITQLGALFGVKLAKEALITPKQAVSAGIPEDIVKQYSETPRGEIKIAADGVKLISIFGGQNG